jgi:subtilisin family serine protease
MRSRGRVLLYVVALLAGTAVCGYPQKLNRRTAADVLFGNECGFGMGVQVQEIPNDPEFDRQWYLLNDGTFSIFGITPVAGADIEIIPAWDQMMGSGEVTVAILDSGVNPNHPELVGQLWVNPGELPGNNKDDDGNGFVDDYHGWNFVADQSDISDDNGHGTALAGIIAAKAHNSVAYAGINAHARLMIVKILGADLSGVYSDWIKGIQYAVRNGARIINLSVAGEIDSPALHDAVRYADSNGVLVVVSAGNSKSETKTFPAGYDEVVAVGSTDSNDKLSRSFNGSSTRGSNYGDHIDLVAPGNAIYGLDRFTSSVNTLWAGTSVSAAVVSGVASLLLSEGPELTANEIKGLLYRSAEDQVGRPIEDVVGWDKFHGNGRVNASRAIVQLQSGDSYDPFVMQLYPVPSTGRVTCKLFLLSVNSILLDLHSMTGQQVFTNTYVPLSPEFEVEWDLSFLPKGVYSLSLTQEGRIYRQRMVLY